MNIDEAKRILLASRSEDAADADVRRALAEVERDAELADWWREQQQVQSAVRESFRTLPVPAGLKDAILAEAKTVRVAWWRQTWVRAAGIAAVLVALLSVFVWRPSEAGAPMTFEQFRDRMVRTIIREYRMDITTNSEEEIRGYLGQHSGHPDFRLPTGVQAVPFFGAGNLTWNGRQVSMVCFERKENVLMYMFVVDRQAFQEAGDVPTDAAPEFAQVVERATASWSDEREVYVLISDAGMDDLRQLVK